LKGLRELVVDESTSLGFLEISSSSLRCLDRIQSAEDRGIQDELKRWSMGDCGDFGEKVPWNSFLGVA
jgi:hypothetical protein